MELDEDKNKVLKNEGEKVIELENVWEKKIDSTPVMKVNTFSNELESEDDDSDDEMIRMRDKVLDAKIEATIA